MTRPRLLPGSVRPSCRPSTPPLGPAPASISRPILSRFVLILLGHVYQRFIGYDVAAEVRSANFAAGIAFGLTLPALAMLMVKAISGEFTSWTRSLSFFAFDAVVGLLLLLLLKRVTDLILLPHSQPKEEIVRDRNVNAGLIQGVLAMGIAAIILFVF